MILISQKDRQSMPSSNPPGDSRAAEALGSLPAMAAVDNLKLRIRPFTRNGPDADRLHNAKLADTLHRLRKPLLIDSPCIQHRLKPIAGQLYNLVLSIRAWPSPLLA